MRKKMLQKLILSDLVPVFEKLSDEINARAEFSLNQT